MPEADDTIFAPASGAGRAGVAIVRVSGRQAGTLLAAVAGGLPAPRRATLRRLSDPVSGEMIDRGLVLWLPGPASFTGEDQAEFHIHGGLAVKAALLACLAGFPHCRPAEPGEFTRRAFFNQRMDLSAVEGLADLVDAETDLQRRLALRQAEGGLFHLAEDWRERLIGIAAEIEAGLDFSDEADVPLDSTPSVRAAIEALRTDMGAQLANAARGETLREGYHVAIAGRPNAGKSTLLNAIARRDVAIVSPLPGTTRDVLEIRCDLNGLPVIFADTAGLRADEADLVEQEGIRRAQRQIERADLVLWLSAPGSPAEGDAPREKTIVVATKADLLEPTFAHADLAVSAATGLGLPALLDCIAARAAQAVAPGDDALLTRERHRVAVSEAARALDRAGEALYKGHEELAAEDMRLAARAIGRLSGRVDVEHVLDRVFAQFCIGK